MCIRDSGDTRVGDRFTCAKVGDPGNGLAIVGDGVESQVGPLYPYREGLVAIVPVASLDGGDHDDQVLRFAQVLAEVDGDLRELVRGSSGGNGAF